MYKKLEEKDVNAILEAGIEVFSRNGFDRAGMSEVAKAAGVSVGVIYKYFEDKNTFFLACVRYALRELDAALARAAETESAGDVRSAMRSLIGAVIDHSRRHPSHNALYNEITSGGCRAYAPQLAREIEGRSAAVYAAMMERALAAGEPKGTPDARLFAFFFDSLLMTLQFSYSCDYYRERMKIYCGGESPDDDRRMTEEFLRFMCGALGV
ncbi:MAG: TetR/AcrR family transcriptional regulator [Oscillospiraceae bacterium]|nr:TetR/AcrR family transcriptional regulator [Oscillospiraceae bacterium]